MERFDHIRWGEDVAAGQKLLQAFQVVQMLLDHLMEEAGGKPHRGDLFFAQSLAKLFQRGKVGREDYKLAAVQQWAPDLQRRCIEGCRRKLQERFFGTEFGKVSALALTPGPSPNSGRGERA